MIFIHGLNDNLILEESQIDLFIAMQRGKPKQYVQTLLSSAGGDVLKIFK